MGLAIRPEGDLHGTEGLRRYDQGTGRNEGQDDKARDGGSGKHQGHDAEDDDDEGQQLEGPEMMVRSMGLPKKILGFWPHHHGF